MKESLREYAAKRDFSKTPEPNSPGPIKSGERLRFVVQKHAARRLHYDLRLELDGALKSWAVAKGPSLVPGEKRLAIHVEDHPLEYADFEGSIPEGQYGAGQVIVWDSGTWIPEGDPRKGYAKGHLTFELKGRKLKGRWHLVRMGQRPNERQERWLLIKADDEAARSQDDPDVLQEAPRSVRSRRTIESVARTRADLPDFIEPCLATLSAKAPSGPEWVHEIKFDGYRIQARKAGDRIELLTRKGLDWTSKFGGLSRAFTVVLAKSAIIDGELVVEDENGTSSFAAGGPQGGTGRGAQVLCLRPSLSRWAGPSGQAPQGTQGEACGDPVGHTQGEPDQAQRAFPDRRSAIFASSLRHGTGGDRVEADRQAVSLRTHSRLAEDEVLRAPGIRDRRIRAIDHEPIVDRVSRSRSVRQRAPRLPGPRGHWF